MQMHLFSFCLYNCSLFPFQFFLFLNIRFEALYTQFESDSSQHEDMEIPQRKRSRSIDGALDRGIRFERRRKSFPVVAPQIQRNGIAFFKV